MSKSRTKSMVGINIVILFLFAITAFAASHEECAVMVPMKGTIWKTGQMVTVRWSGINSKAIDAITLAQPTEEGGYIDVARVASEVPTQPGKYSLKLPANIVPNDNYVIILGNSESIKCISGSFFIETGEDVSPVTPQSPVVPGNAQPPPSSAVMLPSNVGTPASSITTGALATGTYSTPVKDDNDNGGSRTVGHGAVKSNTMKSDASGIQGMNGSLSYLIIFSLIMCAVIEVIIYT